MNEKMECRSCGATGLYKGFAEPKGTAVVCANCGGKGYVLQTGTLFTFIKKKEGVQKVIMDGGTWMLRGASPKTISIEEFEKIQKSL